MNETHVPGFEMDPTARDAVWWSEYRTWGLTVDCYSDGDEVMLRLLDADGSPSNHALSASDARHIVAKAGLGADLMRRWDHYASTKA